MKNLIFIFLLLLMNCKPATNQYIKLPDKQLRNGIWIEKDPTDAGTLISRGRYIRGERVGTWIMKIGGKIYQRDITKNGITKTKIFWPNGKIMQQGISRTEISESGRLWYYSGDWKFYDEAGRLKFIKSYDKGKVSDSIPAR